MSSFRRGSWLLFIVAVVVVLLVSLTLLLRPRVAVAPTPSVQPVGEAAPERMRAPEPAPSTPSKTSLTTPLDTRFEEQEETTCLQHQSLSIVTHGKDWDEARAYVEGYFSTEGEHLLSLLESTLATDGEQAVVTSLCVYAEELYVVERLGQGEEFDGYRAFILTGNEGLYPLGEFLVPFGRSVGFSSVLFDDALGLYARAGDASYASWYYYRVTGETDGIEQVEWCDRVDGGGWTNADEPSLTCEYTYTP